MFLCLFSVASCHRCQTPSLCGRVRREGVMRECNAASNPNMWEVAGGALGWQGPCACPLQQSLPRLSVCTCATEATAVHDTRAHGQHPPPPPLSLPSLMSVCVPHHACPPDLPPHHVPARHPRSRARRTHVLLARRYDAIAAGDYPEWTLFIQTMDPKDEDKCVFPPGRAPL